MLSCGWDGHEIKTLHSRAASFFNYLEPGDVVLADRSFTIAEDVSVHGAKLEIPALT